MRAVVLKKPCDLQVMDVPKPKLVAGQVLVKVSKCGLCGSDVRYFMGENPWAKQTLGREIPNPPNIIFGHEFTGTVTEVHDPADAHLIGKRVGLQTWEACGRCEFCRQGQENLCPHTRHLGHGQGWGKMDVYPGGMAEYCPAFAGNVYVLPDHMTDDQATFFDPMTAALHAVDVGGVKPLDRVAILGAGPIGLLIAQIAKVYGARETFITDIADENIAVARKTGVDHALKVSPTDNGEALKQLVHQRTGGDAGGTSGGGVNVVINTIGTSQSIVDSMALVRKGGTLVLMVTKDEEIRFPSLLLSAERTIRTTSNAMNRDLGRVLNFIASGQVKIEPLLTHRFSLEDAPKAFEAACGKEQSGAIKIVIEVAKG